MEELLNKYSPHELIMFTIILITAVRGIWGIIDWVREKLHHGYSNKRKREIMEDNFNTQDKKISTLAETVNNLQKDIRLLLDSDRDDIKAWITQQHHIFIAKGSIDDFSLQCIEKRYEHYVAEGGNSFIGDLMKDIRNLPKSN